MKKYIIIISLFFTVILPAFSQGEISFGNGTPTKISVNSITSLSTFNAITGAGNYYFALFSSVTATTVNGNSSALVGDPSANDYAFSDGNWTFDAYGISSATAGRFSSTTLDPAGYTQIPGEPANVQFVVIGWSANIGSTIQSLENFLTGTGQAVTGFLGQSVVSGAISTGTAGSLNSPPPIFGGSAPSIPGFELATPTPEPSTMALGAVGGLSLLAFRRKKA